MFNFPDAPTMGQVHTESGVEYVWDGAVWNLASGGDLSLYVRKAGDTMTGHLEAISPAKLIAKGTPAVGTGMASLLGGDNARTGMIEFYSPAAQRLARLGWGTATEIEFQFENGCGGLRMKNGGIHWGTDAVAVDKFDLTEGICLYGFGSGQSQYGFVVTSNSLNYVGPAAAGHKFSCGSKSVFEVYDDTVYVNGNFTVNGVITDNLTGREVFTEMRTLREQLVALQAEVAALKAARK
jgi:hypothetical protein